MDEALGAVAFGSLADNMDRWLVSAWESGGPILSVDRGGPDECGAGERRWYVRLAGEEKDVTTVWLTLGQRTLQYETYVLPSPPLNSATVFELVLRRNGSLVGCHYAIGAEDGIYLRGEIASTTVTESELDRVIGSLYVEVERSFRGLARMAFPSR